MMRLLLKLFVKEGGTTAAARRRVGKLSAVVGIVLNLLLAAAKTAVGLLFGLISVLADGVNNLTDCGSNVVSLCGFVFADKPADKEHPFGHKRAEYIAGAVVALVVLALAVELGVSSVRKVIVVVRGTSSSGATFSWWVVGTLALSAAVKLWMYFFNRRLSAMYKSQLLRAVAIDSISDFAATSAVLASVFVSKWAHFDVDGFVGVAVAVFIAVSGARILRGAFSSLLGEAVDSETRRQLTQRILAFDGVMGAHDLVVHTYGQDNYYATVHVEVDSSLPLVEAHAIADGIERDFAENHGVRLVVHLDPVQVNDPETDRYRLAAEQIVRSLNADYCVHDFRVEHAPGRVNLVFDVVVSYGDKRSDAQIAQYVCDRIARQFDDVYAFPTIDRQLP